MTAFRLCSVPWLIARNCCQSLIRQNWLAGSKLKTHITGFVILSRRLRSKCCITDIQKLILGVFWSGYFHFPVSLVVSELFSECCYADQQLIFHNRKPSLVQLITIIHICLSCKFFTAWNDKYFVTIVLWSILKIALVHSLYSRIIKSFVSLLMFGNGFNFSQDKNQSHF